jgi:hypothetical protein
MFRLAAFLVVALGLVSAQTSHQFQATFTSYNDPLVLGTMLGTVNYDNADLLLEFDYTVSTGVVTEYFDFNKKLRYLYCTSCTAETYTSPMPTFFIDNMVATGTSVTINGAQCSEYTNPDATNLVTTVWANPNNGNLPCRVVYSTGRTIDFANFAPLNNAILTVTANWNCPAQQCNKMIDFVLIFDESGSIIASDFVKEKSFGSAIASNYVFGPENVGMGLIQFSGDARLTIRMTYIQQSFLNAMAQVYQRGGSTCIGCGLQDALTEVEADGRGATVQRVFIMLTDGMNNVDVAQFPTVLADVRASNVLVFAIGVGPYVNQDQINSIASPITGVVTSFPAVPNFSSLTQILSSLVISTCINIPGTPCGAACQGFCSCAGTCVCPSTCNDNNACTDDSCDPTRGFACFHTPHVCQDGNLCTQKNCDPILGCQFPPITCNAPDICHTASCNPSLGCQFPPKDCSLGTPCSLDSCDVNVGCVHTPVNCDRCRIPVNVTCPVINCFVGQCNVTNGLCNQTPLNCDDDNACTDDSCDVNTGLCVHTLHNCNLGNLCTHYFCEPATGCSSVPFNVSTDCNDGTVCTIDSCNPNVGCVHTNVTCNDNNNCTQKLCNYLTGCYYPPVNCLSQPKIAKFIGTCYQALCSNSMGGCYLDLLPGSTVDSCGVCNGHNECVIVPIPSNVPYVIGGALLAVIIIGSIVVCAALVGFGGKKGYDIWLAHRNNMSGASTNPLYNDNGMSGSNPMYSSRVTRM